MKYLPSWIIDLLEKGEMKCYNCERKFNGNSILAVGIKKGIENNKIEALFVDLRCTNCNKSATFEIANHTLQDLAYNILDEMEVQVEDEEISSPIKRIKKVSSESIPNKRKIIKSKITRKEIKEHVDFLESAKTHEEILIAMGMSPEEIEFYNIKKDNKNGK